MKVLNRFSIILFFLLNFFIGCDKKAYEKEQVEIEYFRRGELYKKISTYLTLRKIKSDLVLLYGYEETNESEGESIGLIVTIIEGDKSKILVDNDTIPLVAEKEFLGEYNVLKYYLDIPEMMDEEAFIYLSDNKIQCVSSKTWHSYSIYRYESIDISDLLLKDQTGFFNRQKD